MPPTTAKFAAFTPTALTSDSVTPPGPWFTSVTDCVAETLPADTVPKSRLLTNGDQTSTGTTAAVPWPVRLTARGEPAALLVTLIEPLSVAPAAVAT